MQINIKKAMIGNNNRNNLFQRAAIGEKRQRLNGELLRKPPTEINSFE
jgi:hypothetical protein